MKLVRESIQDIFKPKTEEEISELKYKKPQKYFWEQFQQEFGEFIQPYFNATEKGPNWSAFIFTFDLPHEYIDKEELEEWINNNTDYEVHYIKIGEIAKYFMYKVFVKRKGIKFNYETSKRKY